MNKLAAKEPSMDEILSSIRQIIADDDAAVEKPKVVKLEEAESSDDDLPSFDEFLAEEDEKSSESSDDDSEALELLSEQIVIADEEDDSEEEAPIDFAEGMIVPDDVSFDMTEIESDDQATASADQGEALPDPKLSADLAEQLLEPAAEQAASHAFARLGTIAIGNQAITLEAVIKEMLRPMLKQWLDENLPSVVEKLVEKEIARVTRGGR